MFEIASRVTEITPDMSAIAVTTVLQASFGNRSHCIRSALTACKIWRVTPSLPSGALRVTPGQSKLGSDPTPAQKTRITITRRTPHSGQMICSESMRQILAGFRVLALPPLTLLCATELGALRLKTAPVAHFLTSTGNNVSESSEEGICPNVLSLGASTLWEEP